MKVVLDTNVLVSALIKAGKPRDLFLKLAKEKQLVLSRAILEEFLEVVEDPKVARYVSQQDVTVFLNVLGKAARIVPVKSKFCAVKEGPDDDIVVRTAYDGKADYIVSGDRHLLVLKEYKGIKNRNYRSNATRAKRLEGGLKAPLAQAFAFQVPPPPPP